jgi:CheY-like chemotaxis protein
MVQRLGYDLYTATSGEEAVFMVKERSFDILDPGYDHAPGINGLETFRRILEFAPQQKSVIASGYAMGEHVHEAQQLGADTYIKKPFTLEKIGLAVRKELDDEDSTEQLHA